MRDKESYSPQEVAEIARHYNMVSGMWNFPISPELRKRYEEIVPKNIRDVIDNLNGLEAAAFEKMDI